MWVTSKSRLRQFWESRKSDRLVAEACLTAWYRSAKEASASNWGELKEAFPGADRVGNCTVFDVCNNRYRLIARVCFPSYRIFVLKVMDHKEYDKQSWVEDCDCHTPPPDPA